MRRLTLLICILCLFRIEIYINRDTGECLDILEVASDRHHPCTDENKRDTGCWDEDGNTQLCDAKWIEVEQ